MSKIRLDQYLCQNGLVQSRERAKALIMSGIVFVDEQKVDKAGEMISPDAKVEVRGHDIGYVSRGGLKLEKAMQVFPYAAGWQSLHGHWCLHRRLYRLHAAKRRGKRFTRWTWATASWPGACAPMSASSTWNAPTSAM